MLRKDKLDPKRFILNKEAGLFKKEREDDPSLSQLEQTLPKEFAPSESKHKSVK